MLEAGKVLRDRYQIVKMIGKGGMSTVYQAVDLENQNMLAVKDVERAGTSDNQVVEQSLVGEGRMLMQLANPHLPKIYDIIENPSNFMLVMDYIEGESLDKVIARTGPQSVDRVLNWGMQICEVLHYLHTQPTPIIYRDLKPANVILKPDGHLMLIDFGTARTQKLGVAMQADTICMGTAGFAAPEQFGGIGQSDARTDIFCLGATLYNMVTGHSPCEKPIGILPLERWNPALANTSIAHIIYKCTRNDPNERYQTAMELYQDMRMVVAGEFSPQSKGRSGGLGIRKTDFQRQDVKGGGMISGTLSGFGAKGRSGVLPQKQAPFSASKPGETVAGGWQRNPKPVPQAQKNEAVDRSNQDTIYAKPPEHNAAAASVQHNAVPDGGQMNAAVPNSRQNTIYSRPVSSDAPEASQKKAPPQPQPAPIPQRPKPVMEQPVMDEEQSNDTWRKLMLIGALVAAIFVILAGVLMVLEQTTAAMVFMIIAVGAAALAVVGVVMSRQSQ